MATLCACLLCSIVQFTVDGVPSRGLHFTHSPEVVGMQQHAVKVVQQWRTTTRSACVDDALINQVRLLDINHGV